MAVRNKLMIVDRPVRDTEMKRAWKITEFWKMLS
jgi:hypothetical protein